MKTDKIIYLDNAATTKVDDEVAIVLKETMSKNYGNPSSLHSYGLLTHRKINQAIDSFQKLFGSNKKIIFTSGGTESNNLAIFGTIGASKNKKGNIITSKIEHPSVLEPLKELEKQGFTVTYLDVDEDGIVNIEQFKSAINEDTVLISIMHANNEVGSIQPIVELIKIARQESPNAIFHTDASQTFTKLNLENIKDADLITISAHKIHGPKGIGALIVKESVKIKPMFFGGHQQDNMRSGTQNIPGIIGFCEAIKQDPKYAYISELSYDLIKQLENIKEISINGPEAIDLRLATIINIRLPKIEGEVMLHHLEQDNIFISTGSACSASKKEPSYVLKAIGLDDKTARYCIRVSLSKYNTKEDIDFFAEKLKKYIHELS
jgi:cysteine desulfurase